MIGIGKEKGEWRSFPHLGTASDDVGSGVINCAAHITIVGYDEPSPPLLVLIAHIVEVRYDPSEEVWQ